MILYDEGDDDLSNTTLVLWGLGILLQMPIVSNKRQRKENHTDSMTLTGGLSLYEFTAIFRLGGLKEWSIRNKYKAA